MKDAPPKKDLPVKRFRTQAAWEKWLAANHEKSSGVWLELAKKSSGVPSVSYAEALEVALCYGWIDGQTASVDTTWYRQRFTPRRPRSKWSQINRAAVEKLHAEGRLSPAGIREMEAAQKDGRWEAAYPSSRNMTVPPDLESELEKYPKARRYFEQLDRQSRVAILYRLYDAKKPETRQRRLEEFVRKLKSGEAIIPRSKPQ
ncbi:MAG TPA: YdeI/OmpD-associated family protein [Gemmatimonadales bacterium]|nr:YdeI/OmpD-associated family protein [Gemmatimonadales bacterium]